MDNKTVFVLPCKEGDTVWFETYEYNENHEVVNVGIKPHIIRKIGVQLVCDSPKGLIFTPISASEIGKTVFFSEEEALEALKNKKPDPWQKI